MTVCITGMSRSGTSMITRLLNLCGLYLGEEADLMPANAFNVDGYWENLKFVALNDALLEELGGAWDLPPSWGAFTAMEWGAPHTQAAEALLAELAARAPAGWKDPRTSLTLPFWRKIAPDLRVIICVRNPLEIADSLLIRQQFSQALSLHLWTTYNQRVVAAVPPERRLVTHYERYFSDPAAEITRVLRFAGMDVSEAALDRCRETIARGARHHLYTMQHVRDSVALTVRTLYEGLCAEAGWVHERSVDPVVAGATMPALLAHSQALVQQQTLALRAPIERPHRDLPERRVGPDGLRVEWFALNHRLGDPIAQQEAERAHVEHAIRQREQAVIAAKDAHIRHFEEEIRRLEAIIAKKDQYIRDLVPRVRRY